MLKLEFLPKVVALCMTKEACLLVNQCSGTWCKVGQATKLFSKKIKRVKIKSNAESKHISRSFISIHYQLNPLRETDVKPQFASKIYISDVSNDLRPHSPRHLEKQLGNPASFANRASSRTTHSASVALKHLFLCALVLRWICGGPVILSLEFSLLGSGACSLGLLL